MVDTIRFASAAVVPAGVVASGPYKGQLACNDARKDLCNRMGGSYASNRTAFNTHAGNYNGAANAAATAAKLVAGAGCPALNAQGHASVTWS